MRRSPKSPIRSHHVTKFLIEEAWRQGWNLKALSEEAGFDKDMIGRWKRGEISPRLDALVAVLEILGWKVTVEKR